MSRVHACVRARALSFGLFCVHLCQCLILDSSIWLFRMVHFNRSHELSVFIHLNKKDTIKLKDIKVLVHVHQHQHYHASIPFILIQFFMFHVIPFSSLGHTVVGLILMREDSESERERQPVSKHKKEIICIHKIIYVFEHFRHNALRLVRVFSLLVAVVIERDAPCQPSDE